MKKVAIIVLTVVVLIGITIYADKATRVSGAGARHVDSYATGKPEPELKLKTVDGKDVSLADYKGKVVFVNFWATWCDPCRVEIPWLIAMQNKYGPKGFTVLGIAMDFLKINPVKALYWTAVVNGLLAPFLLSGILVVASDSKLMQGQPSSRLGRAVVLVVTIAMFIAALAMFVL